jgi:outer membrane protein
MLEKNSPRSTKIWYLALIIAGVCLWQPTLLYANDSIWYSSNDPLATEGLTPPPIPDGYLETSACNTVSLDRTLTLTEVVEAALCNNPQARAAYASAKQQAAQLGIAKSAYLPQVNDNVASNLNWANPASASRSNPNSNLSNNIVASYLLYDFGNRDANLENARQLLQAASGTQNSIVQTILLNAIQAYYQVQASMAAVAAALESEHASEESFKAAQARYTAGVSTPADKLQAQTLYAKNSLSRITAEGVLNTAYGSLANVMGFTANQALKLTPSILQQAPPNIDQDINALILHAHVRRPDLLASEAQLKAADANTNASRAAAKPTISVAASNSFIDGSSLLAANNTAVGITLSIPLFAGYAPTYRIRAAVANAEVRTAQRDQLRLQISLEVWRAYQSLVTANESIRAVNVLVGSAQESSRVAFGRYKAGVGNILDTLNAQSALASALQQQIQANLNWNIARTTLAQSIGGLDNAIIQSLPTGNNQASDLDAQSQERQP